MRKMTNKELIAQLRKYVSFERFGNSDLVLVHSEGRDDKTIGGEDYIREATRLYRQTWIDPLIDDLETRVVRNRKPRGETK